MVYEDSNAHQCHVTCACTLFDLLDPLYGEKKQNMKYCALPQLLIFLPLQETEKDGFTPFTGEGQRLKVAKKKRP